jgi:predicted RNA binding protein YcfA (HicA-like mRNA interferase family)
VRPISGRRLAKALKRSGWELMRVNGSHHIFMKPGSSARLSVPIHGDKPLKRGLLHFMLKTSGLHEDDV